MRLSSNRRPKSALYPTTITNIWRLVLIEAFFQSDGRGELMQHHQHNYYTATAGTTTLQYFEDCKIRALLLYDRAPLFQVWYAPHVQRVSILPWEVRPESLLELLHSEYDTTPNIQRVRILPQRWDQDRWNALPRRRVTSCHFPRLKRVPFGHKSVPNTERRPPVGRCRQISTRGPCLNKN